MDREPWLTAAMVRVFSGSGAARTSQDAIAAGRAPKRNDHLLARECAKMGRIVSGLFLRVGGAGRKAYVKQNQIMDDTKVNIYQIPLGWLSGERQ